MSSFSSWVLARSLCSVRLVFFLTNLSFSTWKVTVLRPLRFPSWRVSSLSGLLYPSGLPFQTLFNKSPNQAYVFPPFGILNSFAKTSPYFFNNLKCFQFMITMPMTASSFYIICKQNVRWASSLDSKLISCVRISSSAHSRKLLDCFLFAVWFFQQTSVKLKAPNNKGLQLWDICL